MPALSITFEFNNPWLTKNSHTTQPSITMPQMVNGVKAAPVLTLYSEKQPAAGFYGLGSKTHSIAYVIEGSFRGTCTMQFSNMPSPSDSDWVDLSETIKYYNGLETTGGAGISGGFSGSVSRPTKTNLFEFTGNYAWIRAKLDISQGTLQAIKMNF